MWDSTKPDSTAGTGQTIKEGADSTQANFSALESRGIVNFVQNPQLANWGAGTSSAPDNWTLAGTAATVAQNTTSGQRKFGAFSADLTRAGDDATLTQTLTARAGTTEYFQSRTFILSVWVRATVANRARIGINDGVTTTYSSYHTGGSSLELLTVSKTLDGSATKLDVVLSVDTGDTTAQFDAIMLIEGEVPASFAPALNTTTTKYCVVRNTSDQSIATSTTTSITFDTDVDDPSDFHNTSSNTSRITVDEDGLYLIMGNVLWEGNTTGHRVLQVKKNGGDNIALMQHPPVASGPSQNTGQHIGVIRSLSSGDYVELQVWQNSGGALDIKNATDYSPYFMLAKIGDV